MKHDHDFQIILREVLPDLGIRVTKECSCGESFVEENRSGDWVRI